MKTLKGSHDMREADTQNTALRWNVSQLIPISTLVPTSKHIHYRSSKWFGHIVKCVAFHSHTHHKKKTFMEQHRENVQCTRRERKKRRIIQTRLQWGVDKVMVKLWTKEIVRYDAKSKWKNTNWIIHTDSVSAID